jgi:transcriptional regulator with GAF, ATPase, and Fis domain
MSDALRDSDLLAEDLAGQFQLLLPATDAAQGRAVVERLLARLADHLVPARVGVVAYPFDGINAGQLSARARALVQATGARTVMDEVRHLIATVAAGDLSVLIVGETGVGKELFAEMVHRTSPRARRPFLRLNCASISETLLESELFGHEEGAFTGATRLKEGKFELADGGTLFLDEIGNMSLEFQAKILRVLEYQRFERVAGSESIQVNVRVIAATNADLKQAMLEGKFRPDLYDRLAFEVLYLPPLKDRMDDVPVLAAYFLARFRQEVAGLVVKDISPEGFDRLALYDFPGNIRELKNVVERAVYMAQGEVLTAADIDGALPPEAQLGAILPPGTSPGFVDDVRGALPDRVDAFEAWLCKDALERTRYRQKEAAQLLGLSYDQFRQRYKKYGLGKE